jgi:hypothetical protein
MNYTDHSHINGWGADLALENRPAVPKECMPPRLDVPWDRPERQPVEVEILMSVEHVQRPAAFGTSSPPSGLSGVIRRVAFKLSESDIRHWLLLIFADRINVVEGVIDDLLHGHVPNIFAEMGWNAKFKYNTGNAILKSAIIAGALVGGLYMLNRRKERRERLKDLN